MIKDSQNCVVYTGAGISTGAGIPDYATTIKPFDLQQHMNTKPTFAHHTIVKFLKRGYFKHWLQQNHDALAQKAGCPKQFLNEIHGSWFDK